MKCLIPLQVRVNAMRILSVFNQTKPFLFTIFYFDVFSSFFCLEQYIRILKHQIEFLCNINFFQIQLYFSKNLVFKISARLIHRRVIYSKKKVVEIFSNLKNSSRLFVKLSGLHEERGYHCFVNKEIMTTGFIRIRMNRKRGSPVFPSIIASFSIQSLIFAISFLNKRIICLQPSFPWTLLHDFPIV